MTPVKARDAADTIESGMTNGISRQISVPCSGGSFVLEGALDLPVGAVGLVIFAHGSGSSRLSPRNRFVAECLQRRKIGTLLFDLLTLQEAADWANVFDIGLLAERVADAVHRVKAAPEVSGLKIGLFGASTGAAAALVAAARLPEQIAAVVSRGGRPDLAAEALTSVKAPSLLIVGGADHGVIELNEAAFARLTCEKRLDIVPGATHLFEERGALETVAELAADWFIAHLGKKGDAG